MTRKGFATGEFGVCIIINGNKLPQSDKLMEMLLKAFEGRKITFFLIVLGLKCLVSSTPSLERLRRSVPISPSCTEYP